MISHVPIEALKFTLIKTMQVAIKAPLIGSPFGKSRMAIQEESGINCFVEMSDQVHVRLANVASVGGSSIGMEGFRATYSFTKSEWKIKSRFSRSDCDNILSSPIVDSILSHLLAERKKFASLDLAMKGVVSK